MADAVELRDQEILVQGRALGDPTRHAIFLCLRDADDPVTVAQLTDRFALNHNAIRQHLAKLRDAGLVVEHRDPPSGPGRPPVRYRIAPGAVERWGTPPAYEALAMMLLEVLRTGESPREAGRAAGRRMAADHGTDAGAAEILDAVARRLGFEPHVQASPTGVDVVLARCPFVVPAGEAPEVVCEMHRGIAEGIAAAASDQATITDLVVRPPKRAGCRIEVAVPTSPRR